VVELSTVKNITKLKDFSPKQRKRVERSGFLNALYEAVQEPENENKSALQILVDKAKCHLYPKSVMLLEHGGHMIMISQLLQFYDHVIGGSGRCPVCNTPVGDGMILAHLQDGFDEGHSLTPAQIVEAFVNSEEF